MAQKLAARGGQYPITAEFTFDVANDTMKNVSGAGDNFKVVGSHVFDAILLPTNAVVVGGEVVTETAVSGSTAELDKDGKPIVLADGAYTFSVEATRGGAKLTDAAALMFGSVASVSTGAGGVKLNVPGVGSITMADVKQIL